MHAIYIQLAQLRFLVFENRIEKDTPDTSIRVTPVYTDYPGFGHDGILSASIDLANPNSSKTTPRRSANSTWTTQFTLYYYGISDFINAK